MSGLPEGIIDWDVAPDGLDRVAADLQAMRHEAGTPAYGEIARRIGETRGLRGAPLHEQTVARSTVYDCFRTGRRRVDVDFVVEIASALGLPEAARGRWAARVRRARAAGDGATVVTGHGDVPRPVATFTGRTAALAEAVAALAGETGAVWVSGMGGAGKTQLALAIVERWGSGAFVDLRGFRAESPTVEVASAQRTVLRLLGDTGPDSADDEARAARVARALGATGRVLVLDDAPHAAYVERILGDTAAGRVVVTSRARPDGDRWHHIEPGDLTAHETAELLQRFDGRLVDESSAARAARATGGLPLAVAILGGRMLSHPSWTLDEQIDLIDQRVRSARVDEGLRETLVPSYEDLPGNAARLLRALADLPVAELDREAAGVLLGVGPDDAESCLADLVERSLAISRGESGVALHAIVRAFAREQAETTDSPRERSEAFARLGWFYADRVWAAYATIARSVGADARTTKFTYSEQDWEREDAERWLSDHLAQIFALAHAAPEQGMPDLLFRISEGVSWWLNFAGHHDEAVRLHGAAADVAAEERDVDALAMASLDAGQVLLLRDDVTEAQECFVRASSLISDAGELFDPGLMGVILNMSAAVDLRHGRFDDAATALRRACAIHEQRGEEVRLAGAQINLGVALHGAGRYAEEREVIDGGLALARRIGNGIAVANFLVNLVDLHLQEGDVAAAIAAGEQAVAYAEEVGIPFLVAGGGISLAGALLRAGEIAAARGRIDGASEVARDLGDALTVAEALAVDAAISLAEGNEAGAASACDEAEALLMAGGDPVVRERLAEVRAALDA